MLVNKTSHKFTGKLGQKVDKTKCGHNYKIILPTAPLPTPNKSTALAF